MPITPDNSLARLVILHSHPDYYVPAGRCLTYSQDMFPEDAASLGHRAQARLPEQLKGFMFIEGVSAPATVKLLCDTCDERRQPHRLQHLKFLLGLQ